MKPKECFDMMTYRGDRSEWQPEVNGAAMVEEYSPDDAIIRWNIKLNFALQYIMSIPETMCMRMITRKDWPEENSFAYAIIPYNEEKKQAVEEIGPMKVKSGVIFPHPTDAEKCMITSLDKLNLKYMPNFILKSMIKKEVGGRMTEMCNKYKKSAAYA